MTKLTEKCALKRILAPFARKLSAENSLQESFKDSQCFVAESLFEIKDFTVN